MRQVLADLALSQVAHKRVEYLNMSEARRLAIGIQLVRDPGETQSVLSIKAVSIELITFNFNTMLTSLPSNTASYAFKHSYLGLKYLNFK